VTTPPLISALELAALLDARVRSVLAPARSEEALRPPAVLDASYLLERPEYDGDHRSGTAFGRWREAHIPGSRYVDVQEQFSLSSDATHFAHPEPRAIAAELARIGIPAGRTVVVYDTVGTIFAARLWYLLTWIGVEARVLDGGLDAWTVRGLPTATGDATAPVAVPEWTPSVVRDAWVTREELVAWASDDDRPLVCSLPAATFAGAEATRYARRGHIPGSVNVPAKGLMTEYGRMRPDPELRQAFGDVLAEVGEAGTAPTPAVVAAAGPEVLLYCGGGISASASALALAQLGVDAVRIYDGSLEEWSADPDLPLVVAPRTESPATTPRGGARRRPRQSAAKRSAPE
jgi:thiosulfate/3-mercaptopyruvate sulfurtransferase